MVDNRFYTLEETSIILNVSKSTLRLWDKTRYFVAARTKGKHRRYRGEQIKELQQKMISSERIEK